MAENSVMALTTMRHGEKWQNPSALGRTHYGSRCGSDEQCCVDKLSPENQAVILKAAKESMSYMKDLSEEEKQEFAKLDKMGVKVYHVDKARLSRKYSQCTQTR